jgi:DNA mismatch repair ATPase MutS
MMHFTESITDDGDVVFDYIIRNGPSTTRNAIKLLERMGFDEGIVKRANEVADALMVERDSADKRK